MQTDTPDARVARIAGRQHGRIHVRDLRACGLSADAVTRRVRRGQLHRVHHGVYGVGHVCDTLAGKFTAAVLAGGAGAVLSGWATLALYALVRWDDRNIEVSVPGRAGRRREGITFHRGPIDERDVIRREGIRTVTVARALVQVAPALTDARLTRLVRKAQMERATNVRKLADAIRRSPGVQTRRLAAVIATGPAPTASTDEDIVLDLILDAGLDHPIVNARRAVADTTYVPDMRWPAQQIILEVDSAWHDGHAAQGLDAARQADLEAVGERVLRTTREQAIRHPGQLIQRLVRAGVPVRAPPGGRAAR